MSLLVIRADEIRDLLTMAECIRVMDRAMRAVSAEAINMPPRTIISLGDGMDFFFLMPGSMEEPPVCGAKIVSLYPRNPQSGRPTVQGFVTVFDRWTGIPAAVMDGAEITRIRTAAASALATRELARDDACSHGIFGTGVLAESHLEAIACVRNLATVHVWGRDYEKAQQFADRHAVRYGFDILAVRDAAKAASRDIVSVVTNSPVPVLRGEWLAPGTHLNLVGAHEPLDREADSDAVANSSIYVDSRAGALSESGDLLIPIAEGRISEEDIVGEIGEVLSGTAPGRVNDQQITLYKSLGIVAQDLFAAEFIYRAALEQGQGQTVDFP